MGRQGSGHRPQGRARDDAQGPGPAGSPGMRFAHPTLLLLALPVLGAAAWTLWRPQSRRASLLFPGSPGLWSQEPSLTARLAGQGPSVLKILALLLLVLGLARPQKVTSQ